ncbi:hypothetical protein GOP47_0009364 [Adiantum capillus-veneris]|uniref:Ultraviolet-B-repressible protein n=2 Tax=Adiantum capillus-veneris TaxID=13818 RepID=A0A9D4UXD4_ADICA|nr:hypothetical protein GOP47_0009364 [Adiantum capillus-veneris]
MAATAVASTSLNKACPSSGLSESRLPARHGLVCLPASKASSPLKLVSNGSRLSMSSGPKMEMNLAGPAALALLAAAVIPDIAEAAVPGVSPSLKNLLLSVVAGGVVLVAISGAVAAVSTFDPVKRK